MRGAMTRKTLLIIIINRGTFNSINVEKFHVTVYRALERKRPSIKFALFNCRTAIARVHQLDRGIKLT